MNAIWRVGRIAVLGCLALRLLGAAAAAASIGLSFVSNRDLDAALVADEVAGVPEVAQGSWNNTRGGSSAAEGASGTEADIIGPVAGALVDDTGALSGATVSWMSNGTWNASNGTATPDSKLMNGYIDAINEGGYASVVFENLPYGRYDVYVYFGSDGNGRTGQVRSDTAGMAFGYTTASNAGGGGFQPSNYIQTASTDANPPANWCVFADQTATAFEVHIVRGNMNSGIHAVQIVGREQAGRARIRNLPATELTAASARIAGEVLDVGAGAPSVILYYGQQDGLGQPASWEASIALPGEQTGLFSALLTGLSAYTTYYYRALARNAAGDAWAQPSLSFQTPAWPATATNLPAIDIAATTARLGAEVTDAGGEAPAVTLFYGPTDGGEDPGAWQDSVALGTVSGSAYALIEGLLPASGYWFRAAATNSGGTSWAPSSEPFTTFPVHRPSVRTRPAAHITGSSAELRGEVIDAGFEPPAVFFYYGRTDGGEEPAAWEHSARLGLSSGEFSLFVAGLEPETTYHFRAHAQNSAGGAWAAESVSFTTTPLTASTVVINEIHYDADDKTVPDEFIELHNTGDTDVDLDGWRIAGGIDYLFPAGTRLPARGFLVVAENPARLRVSFGVDALGPYSGVLSNDGETVELRDAAGRLIDEVDYGVGFPWPTAARGAGSSMELVNPGLDNDLGGSWRASGVPASDEPGGGDPGGPGEGWAFFELGETWRYFKGTREPSEPRAAWREPGFDDSAWLTGTGSFGYGEDFLTTRLTDMQGGYSTVYFRKQFEVVDPAGFSSLVLYALYDDAVNVWINGHYVAGDNVAGPEIAYDGNANGAVVEDHTPREMQLSNHRDYLVRGTNVIAVQLLNASRSGSSDAFFDARLAIGFAPTGSRPTPGAPNSVLAPNAPPQTRQVRHVPAQPGSGQEVLVTARVTDPDGVGGVTLHYQLVEPGQYIRKTDPEYETAWTDLPMNDAGRDGDELGGDAIFSVRLPAHLQTHRRLVRYRITVADSLGNQVRTPYRDDEQPNFAYFVYGGVPPWKGSMRPGAAPVVTYGADALTIVAVYHLISREEDVLNCQYNGSYNNGEYRWLGTLVYDGVVYDHIRYRVRGQASTYQVGKNKWKINFNRARPFAARDNHGRPYRVPWDKINVLPMTNPWWRWDTSTDGTIFCEPLTFRLHQLAGVYSSSTHYFHFRIIDAAAESSPTSQYEGDFWGLYLAVEQPEREFLDERGLPDGNIYNMHGSPSSCPQRNQGSLQPTDKSDLAAFTSGSAGYNKTNPVQPLSWWEANLDLRQYYSYNPINLAVNNADMRPEENCNYYHNQATGRWRVLPWDVDLTFEDGTHYDNWENLDYVLTHAAARQQYRNRCRELLDLLLDNDQAARLVDEHVLLLTRGRSGDTLVEANQALWDYHPRKNKKGIWYANFTPALLPKRDFASYVAYTKQFLRATGYGGSRVAAQAADPSIPLTPSISYAGAGGFPVNALVFESSSFARPASSTAAFAALEWRVAEVHHPGVPNHDPTRPNVYEIEGTWHSGELPAFAPTVKVPTIAIAPGRTYRARVRHKDTAGRTSHWSEPIEFTAGSPDASALRRAVTITEIMYNPAPADAGELALGFETSDFEFVEIKNIGFEPVDLTELRFGDGIEFEFARGAIRLLEPGRYALVVRRHEAFEHRYGTGLPVAGEYFDSAENNLSNGGERLELAYGLGTPLHWVQYDDEAPWPAAADGGGHSLVLIAPHSAPDTARQENWRASALVGGSPGRADGMTFAFWQEAHFTPAELADPGVSGDDADPDRDELTNLGEYAFGTDPLSADLGGLLLPGIIEEAGERYLIITYRRRAGANDLRFVVEASSDLLEWRDGPDATVEVPPAVDHGDGTETVRFRSAIPISAAPFGFLRVRSLSE